MLDGWRGIAAVVVVLEHIGALHWGFDAVMLFFVISGYCITAASEAAIRKGLGFRGFMWRRIRRIYPPYLLCIAFFLLTRSVRAARGGEGFHASLASWIENLTLTQWVHLIRHPIPNAAFNPVLFVNTFWSLCYEEQFYLIMGIIFLPPLLLRRRFTIAALMIVGVLWDLASPRRVHGIFVEFWPHFGVGSLLFYRLCRMRSIIMRRSFDCILIASLFVTGASWLRQHNTIPGEGKLPLPECFVVSAFALVLIALRPYSERFKLSPLGRPLIWLGLISYSLYLVHRFNAHVTFTVAQRVLPRSSPPNVLVTAEVIGQILIATVFWYFCERPFLNRPIVAPAGALSPRDEVTGAAEPAGG